MRESVETKDISVSRKFAGTSIGGIRAHSLFDTDSSKGINNELIQKCKRPLFYAHIKGSSDHVRL